MITIAAIHLAPIKSLQLVHPDTVYVERYGIADDRRLYLIDQQGHLVTQRTHGKLVQVTPQYRATPAWLALRFPDGTQLAGQPELGEAVITPVWGRRVRGRVIEGPWSAALSDFCGDMVTLVRADEPGQCHDEYPISLLSEASLTYLKQRTDDRVTFDSRRFRPTFLLRGCQPHEEDEWLGKVIQLGPDLRLHIMARDPRCTITTLDPDTGQRDIDTVRLILSYRPNPRAAYFGVYGIIESPGGVSLGDTVLTPSQAVPPRRT